MSEAVLAPLSTLWTALSPRVAPATPPPDVGAIAAAAEAQGHARGVAEAEALLAPRHAALTAALAAAAAAQTIDAATLQPLFVELVSNIAAAVIDGELRQSSEAVGRLVAAALAAVESDGAPTLYVGIDAECAFDGFITIVDPDLPPGAIRVETARHVVATSLQARLAAIVAGTA